MGSKPRNRNNRNRANSAGKPPSDPELAAIREQRILPVVRDLQSEDVNKRIKAGSVITNLIEDPKCRKLLLREQIVKILFGQTLGDSNLTAKTAGWGILRHLALQEEADFCVHLYRQNVLTLIEGIVRDISQSIESQNPPFSLLPKVHQDLAWNLTSSVVTLLTTFAEAQGNEAITNIPFIVTFLFGLVSFISTPASLEVEILSCLITLSEDNVLLVRQIVDNKEWLRTLMRVKDCAEPPRAVPACGILHNVFATMRWYDHNTPIADASDAILVPILIQSMEVSDSNGITGHPSRSTPDEVLQLALEITASIATSLQEALELGSRQEEEFQGFDDDDTEARDEDSEVKIEEEDDEMEFNEEVNEDDEMEDDDQSMKSEEIDADMEHVLGDGPSDDDRPEEITLERLVRTAAPRILRLADQSVASEVRSFQSHALSALNNIAWTVSSIDFSTGDMSSLHRFWSALAQRIWDQIVSPVLASNTADIELASTVTSLAWAISRSVQGAIKIQPEEQRKFMALYQASKGLNGHGEQNGSKKGAEAPADAFQGLGVKAIGVLGRLALDPAPIELNREIGVFLLTVLAGLPNTSAADAVEALNQIFDIYADKAFAFDEPVFWGDGFYKYLEEVLPKAKRMAKGIDMRKFSELRARADEAVLNLGLFLKYKQTERNGG